MSDIGRRIQRYRLTRYGRSRSTMPMRWVWIALAGWLVWASLVSDHSFLQLWKLERRNAKEAATLQTTRTDIADLDARAASPTERREQAEKALREQGMARPGELVYRVQPRNGSNAKDKASPAPPETP